MTLYYLDSSAWVKRYLTEPGSAWIRALFERDEPFACCLIGYTEVSAALARQSAMLHVPVDAEVVRLAANLAWEHRLRGADAIHLAAMQWLRESLASYPGSLTVVTADAELVAAAAACRFSVLNPLVEEAAS
jgi:predicted nucleic acid-binding protein